MHSMHPPVDVYRSPACPRRQGLPWYTLRPRRRASFREITGVLMRAYRSSQSINLCYRRRQLSLEIHPFHVG
jgi:hypothetical protein